MSRHAWILTVFLAATGVTLIAADSQRFLDFAINADTLYPALLAEELRADLATLGRFRPSRVPSFVPDLVTFVGLDLATGSWRTAWWGYGFVAVCMISVLGGHLASLALGRPFAACVAALALVTAGVLLVGLAHYDVFAASRSTDMFEPDLPVNIHLMLLMPVFQSGAFIAGLAVVALAWRFVTQSTYVNAATLMTITSAAVASNAIVIAHAALPSGIALLFGLIRGDFQRGRVVLAVGILAAGSALGILIADMSGRENMPIIATTDFLSNARDAVVALPGQPMVLLALMASIPIALAFLFPTVTARRLGIVEAAGFRFVIVTACGAIGAGLTLTLPLYYIPLSWRYAAPLAWWPAILFAGLVAMPLATLARPRGAVPLVAAALLAISAAASSLGGRPALADWRPALAACLDRIDPDRRLDVGLAGYWNARLLAAAGDWRRQFEQVNGDGSAAIYINDPGSFVQRRGAPPGSPPEFSFIVLDGLEPDLIRAVYGNPESVLLCDAIEVWAYAPAIEATRMLGVSPDLRAWLQRR